MRCCLRRLPSCGLLCSYCSYCARITCQVRADPLQDLTHLHLHYDGTICVHRHPGVQGLGQRAARRKLPSLPTVSHFRAHITTGLLQRPAADSIYLHMLPAAEARDIGLATILYRAVCTAECMKGRASPAPCRSPANDGATGRCNSVEFIAAGLDTSRIGKKAFALTSVHLIHQITSHVA